MEQAYENRLIKLRISGRCSVSISDKNFENIVKHVSHGWRGTCTEETEAAAFCELLELLQNKKQKHAYTHATYRNTYKSIHRVAKRPNAGTYIQLHA